jgi:hypothetical protein
MGQKYIFNRPLPEQIRDSSASDGFAPTDFLELQPVNLSPRLNSNTRQRVESHRYDTVLADTNRPE